MKTPKSARSSPEPDSRPPAFTLLEVIVATALFAVSVVALTAAYVNVITNIDRVKADLALENELALVRTQILLEPEIENVETGGDIVTATHGRAYWTAVVEPTNTADLFHVRLEITLEPRAGETEERTLEQNLHLLRPDWSDPIERDELRAARQQQLEELQRTRPL